MRNKLGDLNNHLFAQLERLGDEELTGEELKDEILRAKAVTDVAATIIDNANTVLNAKKLQAVTLGRSNVTIPKMLED
ncbi:hypothetical protein [Clostridium sp. HBUAS56017]|uniref:hypothetical protein n=1 Tax=Clostridium sp. HBUAS56017 TaxID=2571128 RepID=UPI001178B534|nr:hypothetical protein [Clostridium sp. HBUAS56017]